MTGFLLIAMVAPEPTVVIPTWLGVIARALLLTEACVLLVTGTIAWKRYRRRTPALVRAVLNSLAVMAGGAIAATVVNIVTKTPAPPGVVVVAVIWLVPTVQSIRAVVREYRLT